MRNSKARKKVNGKLRFFRMLFISTVLVMVIVPIATSLQMIMSQPEINKNTGNEITEDTDHKIDESTNGILPSNSVNDSSDNKLENDEEPKDSYQEENKQEELSQYFTTEHPLDMYIFNQLSRVQQINYLKGRMDSMIDKKQEIFLMEDFSDKFERHQFLEYVEYSFVREGFSQDIVDEALIETIKDQD